MWSRMALKEELDRSSDIATLSKKKRRKYCRHISHMA